MADRSSPATTPTGAKDSAKTKRKTHSTPGKEGEEEGKITKQKSELVLASLVSSGLGSPAVLSSPQKPLTTDSSAPPKGYCKFMYERDAIVKDESKPKVSRKTKRKVAATKHFLRQYYSELVLYLARRAFRSDTVNAFLGEQDWTPEEKLAYLKMQYEKESQYLRLRRRRTALNDFAILALLGRGGYGEVYLCRKIDTGEVLALKRMKKARFTEKNDVLRVLKEREVMVKSNSPWLVRLKYCFQTETHLYMAMEYVPGGDVKNLLDHFGAASEDEARFYIAEMLLAVADLHVLGYIHRDLKPDNFMIDKSGHLKLIDFGLSKDGWKQKYTKASFRLLHGLTEAEEEEKKRDRKKKKNVLLRGWTATWNLFSREKEPPKPRIRKNYSVVGSPEYMAVEILLQEGYDHLCDFWSLGVILYEFIFGFTPFGAPTALQVFNNIKNWPSKLQKPPVVEGQELPISPEGWDLITKLICAPDKRLGKNGVDEIRAHPFFKGFDFSSVRDVNPPFIPNLADELDTTYFVGMEEDEDGDGDETHDSIDFLLNKAIAKSKKEQSETTLSTIFSHKDKAKKLTDAQGNAAANLTEKKEGSEDKLLFNASFSRFDFAGFGYKHDELAQAAHHALRTSSGRGDGTTTPKISPRESFSTPASPGHDDFREKDSVVAPRESTSKSPRDNTSATSKVSSTSKKSSRSDSTKDLPDTPTRTMSGGIMSPTFGRSPSRDGGSIQRPTSPVMEPSHSGSGHEREHSGSIAREKHSHHHSPRHTPPDSPAVGSLEHPDSNSSSGSGKKRTHKRQGSNNLVVSPRHTDSDGAISSFEVEDGVAAGSGSALSKIKKRLSALRNKFKKDSDTPGSGSLTGSESEVPPSVKGTPKSTSGEEEDSTLESSAISSTPKASRRKSSSRSRSRSPNRETTSRISVTSPSMPPREESVVGRARSGSVGGDNHQAIVVDLEIKRTRDAAHKRASADRPNKRASADRVQRPVRTKIPRAESEMHTSSTVQKAPAADTFVSSGGSAPSLLPEAQKWKERILAKAHSRENSGSASPSPAPSPNSTPQHNPVDEAYEKQMKFKERILAKAAQMSNPQSPAPGTPSSPAAAPRLTHSDTPPGSAHISPSPSLSTIASVTRRKSGKPKSPHDSSSRTQFSMEGIGASGSGSGSDLNLMIRLSPSGSPVDSPTDLSPREGTPKEEKRRSFGRKKRSLSHATKPTLNITAISPTGSVPATPLESPENSPRGSDNEKSQPSSPRFIKTSISKEKGREKLHQIISPPSSSPGEMDSTSPGRPRRGTMSATSSPFAADFDVEKTKKEKRRSEGRVKREKSVKTDISPIVESDKEDAVSPKHRRGSPEEERSGRHDRLDSNSPYKSPPDKSSPDGQSKHRIVIR